MADETRQSQQVSFVPVRANDFRTIYSNGFKTRITLTDFTIGFQHQTDVPSTLPSLLALGVYQNALMEDIAVTMSLPFLKILAVHLMDTIEAIERYAGPIRIPVNARTPKDQMEQSVQVFRENPMTG